MSLLGSQGSLPVKVKPLFIVIGCIRFRSCHFKGSQVILCLCLVTFGVTSHCLLRSRHFQKSLVTSNLCKNISSYEDPMIQSIGRFVCSLLAFIIVAQDGQVFKSEFVLPRFHCLHHYGSGWPNCLHISVCFAKIPVCFELVYRMSASCSGHSGLYVTFGPLYSHTGMGRL